MAPRRVERPELSLPPGTLVVADLHLDLQGEDELAAFTAWLGGLRVPALVLLGDVFDYWIGRSQTRTPGARRVLAALGELSAGGARLLVVPGNRDFLLDREFERATGARLCRSGLVARLPDGRRALLIHGDELATRDRAYQRLRRVLRSGAVLWLARTAPSSWIDLAARRLRRRSRRAVRRKDLATTDLDPEAARSAAAAAGAEVLVCGHVHRFRDEPLAGGIRWLVLDAFGGGRDAFVLGDDGRFTPRSAADLAGG